MIGGLGGEGKYREREGKRGRESKKGRGEDKKWGAGFREEEEEEGWERKGGGGMHGERWLGGRNRGEAGRGNEGEVR